MKDQEQIRIEASSAPRRTMMDWDNYLVEKIAELRQFVDEYSISASENVIK